MIWAALLQRFKALRFIKWFELTELIGFYSTVADLHLTQSSAKTCERFSLISTDFTNETKWIEINKKILCLVAGLTLINVSLVMEFW